MRKVILDECLPKRLARLLPGHDVTTVPEAGLAGFKNGKLLAAIRGRCEVFLTIDANLEYQQNLGGLDFAVVVIHAKSNRLPDLEPLADDLRLAVATAAPGTVVTVPRA